MQSLPGGRADGPGSLHGVSRLGGHQGGAGHDQHARPGQVLPGDAQEDGQQKGQEQGVKPTCTARVLKQLYCIFVLLVTLPNIDR